MWYRFMNLGENLGSLPVHLFYELDLPTPPLEIPVVLVVRKRIDTNRRSPVGWRDPSF